MAKQSEDVEKATDENGGASLHTGSKREEAMSVQLVRQYEANARRSERFAELVTVHLGPVSEGAKSEGESSFHQSIG